ncbi:MAG: PASTA domain-containing protein [Candidatus Velthaea sp.]|jgi:serine/threonine-protein kinase
MQLDSPNAAPRRRKERPATTVARDWIFALALAFAVGVVVWFGRSVKDFFEPTVADVFVPSFLGQTIPDATAEAQRIKLRATVIANQPSDRWPKDVIMSQQPAAGSQVRPGREISLVVSTGVTIFPMPDLRYESMREANLTLDRSKLQLVRATVVANDDVPANHVLSQDPLPLTSVREGTKVTLTISKGPPSAVRVPNFVGEFIDDARADAARAKVHFGQIVWTPFGPDGPPRGLVAKQNPAPGAQIDPFAPVSLQVSAGPTEFGYLIRQVHATATVPARDSAANVRMEIHDETGTWNVYDGFAQGGQKLDFNLTVVGKSELDTYINNELLSQVTLGGDAPHPSPSPTRKPRKS